MSNKTVFGTILVGLGTVWLLESFGIIGRTPSFWQILPILLIAFGVWRLVKSQFQDITSSLAFIVSGVLSGLLQLDIISWRQISNAFWPLVVMLIGIGILTTGNKKESKTKIKDAVTEEKK